MLPDPRQAGAAAAIAHTLPHPGPVVAALRRNLVIGLIAFLTLVDLFATQAVLPALALRYGVGPAAMGTAVNASTLGMAIAGLAVALAARRLDRRLGTVMALALLAVPTSLLAIAPDLGTFAALRVAQGMCMAAAFTLTLAHLGERFAAADAAAAFAAYVTGNVASNLVGRLLAAWFVDELGLAGNFLCFAVLNLAGAALAFFAMRTAAPAPMAADCPGSSMAAGWRRHLRDPRLRAAFAIGFCLLFAFIGTFTYVNFVLVAPPYGLAPMQLGLVYFVFLPSIVTTPLAGVLVARWGALGALRAGLGLALVALPLLLVPAVEPVLLGLALVAIGTFLAQATATGYVGRTAQGDRAAASGLYLAAYFTGGLVGTAVLGLVLEGIGWAGCVLGIGLALAAAAVLARWWREAPAQ